MDDVRRPTATALPADAPELVARVLDDIDLGLDALMVGRAAEGHALLDEVEARLPRGRTRVLRVAAPSPGTLALAGLLARLRPGSDPSGQAPEQAIAALTRLEPGCERVVLLVSSAESLERSAWRAIQLAAEAQPKLRLVLAGTPDLLPALRHPELAALHARLNRAADLPDDDEDEALPRPHTGPAPSARLNPPPAERRDRTTAIAGTAMAILAAIGIAVFARTIAADTAANPSPSAASPSPAQPARLETGSARPEAQADPARQPVLQDLPGPVPARNEVAPPAAAAPASAPPAAAPATPGQNLTVEPAAPATPPPSSPLAPKSASTAMVLSAPTDSAPPSSAIPLPPPPPPPAPLPAPPLPAAPSIVAGSAPAAPSPQAATVPPQDVRPPAVAAPVQSAETSPPAQARRRETAPRRPAASPPRLATRPPAYLDQPSPGQPDPYWDGRPYAASPWPGDRPNDRRPDSRPSIRYETRPSRGYEAWPLAPDEPRGTIGTYSGGPGGFRSFRYGS